MSSENNIKGFRGPNPHFVWGIIAIIVLCGVAHVGCVQNKDSRANSAEVRQGENPDGNAALEQKVADLEQKVAAKEQEIAANEQEVTSLKGEITKLENFKSYPGARMVKVINGVEFAFRWCPAGEFAMGSPEKEWDSEWQRLQWDPKTKKMEIVKNETIKTTSEQIHNEKVEGFWMLETEVTVKMFRAFVNKTGYQSKGKAPMGHTGVASPTGFWNSDTKYSWEKPGFYFFQRDKLKNTNYTISENQPVTTISYHDAVEFCKWLSEETGLNVDLPTEAQWEYSCRAGTSTAYNFGDAVVDNSNVNCNARESFNANAPQGSRYKFSTNEAFYSLQPFPVRHYKPNNWGIYDMHGNVREWCKDCIVKSGGWHDIAWICRSAWQGKMDPETRIDYQGFRVIISEN